ncbi:MAG: metallophosphoesterase [Bacteroidota bacterium]
MSNQRQINTKELYTKLTRQFESSPEVLLSKHDRWVVFSDLHMGDGSSTDDFKRNASLFTNAISKFYKPQNHALILNGDIEELQRFKINKIVKKWEKVYQLFDTFHEKKALYKTIGNHDLELQLMKDRPFAYHHYESLKLKFNEDYLFIFHGHQASKKYQYQNELIGFTLKYFANPLGIKSYSVSHSNQKQYKIEKRAYGFSSFNKIVSVIGHTHRPLFESLHKVERLKFKIELLCRDYSMSSHIEQERIKMEIKAHRKELRQYYRENKDYHFKNNVYNAQFHIPCVFNSGCVVGKRGMTCLEIEDGKIRLVHWFDKNISKKYLTQSGYMPQQLVDTDFYRLVINEESLNYIFTRIKFLS